MAAGISRVIPRPLADLGTAWWPRSVTAFRTSHRSVSADSQRIAGRFDLRYDE
ncbi:MAG: hypothetical protein Ct9H300mP1_27250 [Planctomycetaceae bacterium]|nr:MAG: hypothetical protein Ct9H300mP1_27250 [Planctomycetaceae bacterium]